MTDSLSAPVHLNMWKHSWRHYHLLLHNQACDMNHLLQGLKQVGSSQMDLYYGPLPEHRVGEETMGKLTSLGKHREDAYLAWLGKDYHTLTLSDQSVWVLRAGYKLHGHYVHIHPGRYSPHTFRVKAHTLKVAVCTAFAYLRSGRLPDLAQVNNIRTDLLNLSPVKTFSPSSARLIGALVQDRPEAFTP